MALPTFVAVGTATATPTNGAGSIAPPLPAGILSDDILILFVEASNEPIGAIAGWFNVGSGTVAQATGLVTGLTARWCRYTGVEPAPTVTSTPQNHLVAQVMAIRGCTTGATPIHGTPAVLSDNGTTTAVSIPGGTTTAADCLIVAGVATGTDVSSTARITGWTNASLASLTERMDFWNTTGNGGGFGVATGGKATAGTYSATTATLTTGNTKACMSFALLGASAPTGGPWWKTVRSNNTPTMTGYSY